MHKLEQHLRALVITLLITLGLISGLPRVSPEITKRLPKGLAARIEHLPELQERLLAPFAPMAHAFGIYSENWPLFTRTGGVRNRIRIEGLTRGAGNYHLLYRIHDPEHSYLATTIEYRHFRNMWNPHRSGNSGGYETCVRYFARRALLDHPELEAARVRQEQVDTLPEGRGIVPNGNFVHEVVVKRSELTP